MPRRYRDGVRDWVFVKIATIIGGVSNFSGITHLAACEGYLFPTWAAGDSES